MTEKVKPIPEGYHSVTPYLIVNDAAKALDFYRQAFNAKEEMRFPGPGGKIMHAEIVIGNSHVMLADEFPEMGHRSPTNLGGTPISLMVYVENVDQFVDQAVSAGAKITRPVADQFYGDRTGGLEDPFGHQWYISTHVEDVSPEEMQKRMASQKCNEAGAEAASK